VLVLYVVALLCVIGLAGAGFWALQTESLAETGPVRDFVRGWDCEWYEWVVVLASFALGWGLGVLFSLAGWHWRVGWILAAVPAPLAALPFTYIGWIHSHSDGYGYGPVLTASERWAFWVAAAHGPVQSSGVLVGLLAGRPVARTVLRVLLPPRPRMHFDFLWFVDGLLPPPATGGGPSRK
jgi:hypothetical protein